MNLDELQSVQSKERRNDTLQHLRDSFYDDVGEYVADLKNRRDLAADRADDPFGSPEVRRLTDEIETATEVVEKVYERRMGKLVKQASLAAAGMNAETEGMTVQERDLFDDIVDSIEANKADVLATLSGETAEPSDESEAAPNPTAEGEVSAAAMMGDDGEAAPEPDPVAGGPEPTTDERHAAGADRDTADPASTPGDRDGSTGTPAPGAEADAPAAGANGEASTTTGTDHAPTDVDADPLGADDDADRPPTEARAVVGEADDGDGMTDGGPAVGTAAPAGGADATDAGATAGPTAGGADDTERSTVRITDDVGQIFGVDGREYDLERSDVVQLPEQNAAPLLEQDAAERLD